MDLIKLFPTNVEIKYDHLNIDGLYISIITIIAFETNIQILKTLEDLIGLDEIEVSFHIKRENNYEIVKRLTNIISETSSEIASVSKNQIDINVIDNIKNKASELKKRIQVDNEQIYMISVYVQIKAETLTELVNKQRKYIHTLYAKQIIAKPNNFRQKEAYIATLPLMCNSLSISRYTHSFFTEQALSKMYPFFVKDVASPNGILVGTANNNPCLIDLFSEKNNNYNMCIFGASGTGKSYFVKLMIIKNAYKGIRQIIIDPEGEYSDLVENLGGHIYTIKNYNPFEINESLLKNENFLDIKVQQVYEYVLSKVKITNKEKLKKCIVQTYNNFDINKDVNSLYRKNSNTKMYIKPHYIKHFPNINDLTKEMKKSGLNDVENIEISENKKCLKNDADIYCFNLNGASMGEIQEAMKIFMPKIYELIKQETLIYFDEMWKIIGQGKDKYTIENIYNMFKTLRKKKAGIISISQDICDLFALDNGDFGKSILNNAYTKVLFSMEWQEIDIFEKLLHNIEAAEKIKMLTRGNTYVSIGNANFNLEVKATDYEHKMIEGEVNEKNTNSNE